MKKYEIEIMSKKEENLVDILHQSGFDSRTAKTLVYMLTKKTAHNKDIERSMDLSQPAVSVGAKELRRLGILSVVESPKRERGRPLNLYTLNKSVPEVKNFLIKGMREEIEKIEKNIEVIKTLISD